MYMYACGVPQEGQAWFVFYGLALAMLGPLVVDFGFSLCVWLCVAVGLHVHVNVAASAIELSKVSTRLRSRSCWRMRAGAHEWRGRRWHWIFGARCQTHLPARSDSSPLGGGLDLRRSTCTRCSGVDWVRDPGASRPCSSTTRCCRIRPDTMMPLCSAFGYMAVLGTLSVVFVAFVLPLYMYVLLALGGQDINGVQARLC